MSHGVLHVLECDKNGVQGFHRDEGVLGAGKNNRVRVNALTRSPRIRFINTLLKEGEAYGAMKRVIRTDKGGDFMDHSLQCNGLLKQRRERL